MNTTQEQTKTKIIISRPTPTSKNRWWLIGILAFVIGTGIGLAAYYSKGVGLGAFSNIYYGIISPPFSGKTEVTVLLIGTDNSGNGLGDSLMLARVDTQRKRIGVISIPRDSRAEIPDHGIMKINTANALGGYDLTLRTVQNLLGLGAPIDYYVEVNSEKLGQFVDSIGGVEIDVEKRMRYRDRHQNLKIDLQPGMQQLNGEQAIGYVRFRHDALGDIGRMTRQQNFIRAVIKRLLSPTQIVRIRGIADSFRKTVKTNLNTEDIVYLAKLADKLGAEGIPMASLAGEPRRVRGVDYWNLDEEAAKRIIADILYGRQCAVELVDATGNGGGREAANILQQAGFKIVSLNTAPQQPETRVIDYHGRPEKGRHMLRLLSTDELIHKDDPTSSNDFTVEVGQDFHIPVNPAPRISGAQEQ
jgi:LCP family protein required for cell wall assembly